MCVVQASTCTSQTDRESQSVAAVLCWTALGLDGQHVLGLIKDSTSDCVLFYSVLLRTYQLQNSPAQSSGGLYGDLELEPFIFERRFATGALSSDSTPCFRLSPMNMFVLPLSEPRRLIACSCTTRTVIRTLAGCDTVNNRSLNKSASAPAFFGARSGCS